MTEHRLFIDHKSTPRNEYYDLMLIFHVRQHFKNQFTLRSIYTAPNHCSSSYKLSSNNFLLNEKNFLSALFLTASYSSSYVKLATFTILLILNRPEKSAAIRSNHSSEQNNSQDIFQPWKTQTRLQQFSILS